MPIPEGEMTEAFRKKEDYVVNFLADSKNGKLKSLYKEFLQVTEILSLELDLVMREIAYGVIDDNILTPMGPESRHPFA